MSMNITLSEIANQFQSDGIILEILKTGNSEATDYGKTQVERITAVETSGPGDLVFVDKVDYLPYLSTHHPSAVVTSKALKDAVLATGCTVLVVKNVALAHALMKQKYSARNFAHSGWSGIHASAVVHESADVASTAVVEPLAVIGARAKIADGCRIMSGVIVENDVSIGANSVLHPKVVVGYGCRLGAYVVIESGSVIGSQGFGFAQDERRKSHTIPQTGIVVLEDRVRVGANCCIDRAAYGETKIGAGTKIDNLCHIAHNVQIGEDCLLTAMLIVAGSSRLGNRVMTSGGTGVLDHINICDDVVLLHRAGVAKDIEKPGLYAGYPLQPLSDYLKNSATIKSLNEMRKRLGDLERRMEKLIPV